MNLVVSNKLQIYSCLLEIFIITGIKIFKKNTWDNTYRTMETQDAINDIIHTGSTQLYKLNTCNEATDSSPGGVTTIQSQQRSSTLLLSSVEALEKDCSH